MDLMADTADMIHPDWTWDGTTYPKTKRSHGPNQAALDDHAEVLVNLFKLAPNGYPDAYKLRDLLMQLHLVYNIFPKDDRSAESKLVLSTRALMAADRWRIR